MTDSPTQIEITVNGEAIRMQSGSSVADLLRQLEIKTRAIAVEINQEIQPANQFADRVLESGDVLEVVTLVGGG